jgi:hypothetical protein
MALLDKYEVKHFCVAGDQIGINVRHWETIAESLGGAMLQEIADQFSAVVANFYKAWMPPAARYVGTTVQGINTVPPILAPTASTSGQGDGFASGELLPRQVAGLVHIRSRILGRHGRGRMYIPFGTEDWNSIGGKVEAGGLAILASFAAFNSNSFLVSGGTGSTRVSPRIRNRLTNDLTIVDEAIGDDRWATQRRRGEFGRTNSIPF